MELARHSPEERITLLQAEVNKLRNTGGASHSDLELIQAWIESGKALLLFTEEVDAHAEIDLWVSTLDKARLK